MKHIWLSKILAAGLLGICLAQPVCAGSTQLEETDPFQAQTEIDETLLAEAQAGYSFEEAAVIIDPYNCSPLTAVIVFTTEEETGVDLVVKGKNEKDNITASFPAAKEHIIPVYGLYNGDTTIVELTLDDGQSQEFEVVTEAVEIPVGEITAEMIREEAYDFGKMTFACSLGGFLYALDSEGDVRWYYNGAGTMGVHLLENGHLMVPTAYTLKTSYYKSGLQEIDLSGKVYCDYEIPGGQHHDFQELESGNLLVASDAPDFSSIEDYVVEIDRETGEVVWELDVKDLVSIEDGQSASMNTDGTKEEDWLHNNSLWYDAANDLVLLSCRHKDAIIAIRKSEKTLAWILGDPADWNEADPALFFTPTGDDFEWFYAQHEVTMLDNGDIMLFDNGTAKVKRSDDANRVTGDDVYSRAVIYHIDTDAMTAEQVFQYGKERGADWYSDWISGSESQDGTADCLWITAGSHLRNVDTGEQGLGPADMFSGTLKKSTRMDLVANGELAYELFVEGDGFASLTFRSMRLPVYTGSGYLDVTAVPAMKGSLGVKPFTEAEEIQEAQALDLSGWIFTLDPVKLSVSGSYVTQTAAEELAEGTLILKNEKETRAYTVTQNAAQSEEKTSVAVSGWVSREGLEGSYDVFLSLDGTLYDTGYSV